jgi:hypothetical protein
MIGYIVVLILIILTIVLYKINKPGITKCHDCGICQDEDCEKRD